MSKRHPGDTVDLRMFGHGGRSGLPILLIAWLSSPMGSAHARPSEGPRRYVSAQAYYHALRATLAESRSDLPTAVEELQLALVYDSDSVHLTLELGRLALRLGRLTKARRMVARAARLAPRDHRTAYLTARVALAEGRKTEADRALVRAMRWTKDDLGPAMALAQLRFESGRTKSALSILGKAAALDPEAPEPWIEMASIQVEQGRFSKAARSLDRALARGGDDDAVLIRLFAPYERLGRLDALAEQWRRYLAKHRGSQRAYFEAARVELAISEGARAQALLDTYVKHRPGEDTHVEVGRLLASEGAYEAAIPHFERVLARHPDRFGVRYDLGRALMYQGRSEDALAMLRSVPASAEVYLDAVRWSVLLLLEQGPVESAVAHIGQVRANGFDTAELWALEAFVWRQKGNLEQAAAVLRTARRRGLRDARLVIQEAEILVRSEGLKAALLRLETHRRSRPGYAARLYAAAADLCEREGRSERRREYLQSGLAHDPRHPELLRRWGRWLLEHARWAEAERVLMKTLRFEPQDASVMAALGWARFQRGEARHGRAYLRRAARLNPRDPEVSEWLGDVLSNLGDARGARHAYEQSRTFLQTAPGRQSALLRVGDKLADLESK